MSKTEKISNLLACYEALVSGVPLEALKAKYVRADILVALELFKRGITLKALADFIAKRDAHLAKMRRERL